MYLITANVGIIEFSFCLPLRSLMYTPIFSFFLSLSMFLINSPFYLTLQDYGNLTEHQAKRLMLSTQVEVLKLDAQLQR